ncbi:MFS monocarboxylate transporter, putative [Talaromyces stipitatus ATCC 10500]|uniref:MFS monocarboxylate transporter, putative n=1 Tax=Talaromyces stipitatus (strain ATCC 10500 / CBS 375.48 / QM 6759 / NRRL 1006) TaxID=441959 RepID=B8MSA8_TALSN|nr:MFS monocarboxylate transporter, putative [Talaromyces stipitatus ATCC 10500]EED12241.1 MFS monocarboxylate transporter, putative [Talaromyces stipitatus ATCC 10500]
MASILEMQPYNNTEHDSPAISLSRIQTLDREQQEGSSQEDMVPVISSQEPISNSKAIIIVIASFIIVFTCCGINFAFGIYQALYETLSHEPNTPFTGASPAIIDLIGTTAVSVMTIGGPLAVGWAKRFSPRKVTLSGAAIFTLAHILASFGTKLWHFELTQGLLLGVGTCLAYMTSVTVAPTWFSARRGLAMGIILSGTGVGGLVWAPALKACIDAMGYRNALRLTGAVSFVLNTGAGAAMTWEPSRKAQIEVELSYETARNPRNIFAVPLVDLRLVKTRKFIAQALGGIFQGAAYYIPVFFFATYASTLGYSDTAGANFIALSNACNAIGKVVIGYAADRYGRLNVLLLTTIISALSALVFWIPSTLLPFAHQEASRGLFITFTIFYGIFASAYVALFPTSLVELFGPQNFASVNGFLYMLRGLATMVGTPVSGLLIRGSTAAAPVMTPKMYEGMSILVTMLLFATAFSVVWVRVEAMVGPDGRAHWKWRL